ncbi:MAG TPA: metal ABC transporter permease [Gemmataceae bacterium]|nr:metal ABC transporter permease [Gemmataceae bacterium]
MNNSWLDKLILDIANLFPDGSYLSSNFNLAGLLAVILVSLICGAVGSLVVANRMAFFSDALAHCAFAGVALGLLLGLVSGATREEEVRPYVTLVMIVFGVAVGLGIAFVRESTLQSSDTVIGVFFAGSLGLGAIFLKIGEAHKYYPPEDFLFGDLVFVRGHDLIVLFVLVVVTLAVLAWLYNDLVIVNFNRSLALSRRVRVRLCNYAFIILLALIVNLCLKSVGVLLINALLIVPAATGALVSRNLRQLFWWSVGLCVLAGIGGHWLSWELQYQGADGRPKMLGQSGSIVLLSVLLFFGTLSTRAILRAVRRWRDERRGRQRAVPVGGDGLAFSGQSVENKPPE